MNDKEKNAGHGSVVAWRITGNYTDQPFKDEASADAYLSGLLKHDPDGGYKKSPLFAAQSAVVAASVPEGWQLVPKKPTPEMVNTLAEGNYSISITDAYIEMLKVAPVAAAPSIAAPAEVERDAKRYRWLRAHAGIKSTTAETVVSDPLSWTDAAVDLMMKGGE